MLKSRVEKLERLLECLEIRVTHTEVRVDRHLELIESLAAICGFKRTNKQIDWEKE